VPRLLVLGGDAAGMTAASHVRRAVPEAEILVVERGPYTSYSMCGIPYLVGGEVATPEDLVVRDPAAFRAQGIDVRMRTEAVAIDPAARRVTVRDLADPGRPQEELGYDLLLYTVGAHPTLPKVPGADTYGMPVHVLDEGVRLRAALEALQKDAPIVVIGAGYIGMELAEALVQRGFGAVLLDRAEQVMRPLDPDMAGIVEDRLVEFGIDVRLGHELREVRPAGRAFEVVTDQGVLPAELVVVATGSHPNVEMAVAAGCALGDSGALRVDGRLRTSVEGIWAAGDCVESVNLVDGSRRNVQLGTHANKQGRVAGIDIAAVLRGEDHGDAVFPGHVGTAITKVCEWEIARTGLAEYECEEQGIPHAAVRFEATARAGYFADPGAVHVKMLAEEGSGRILGAQLIGNQGVGKRIDVAAVWCQLRVTAPEAQFMDLSYAPPFGGVWDIMQVAARKLTAKLGLSPAL
jgi:NADPH-dependent 2,4-dienoyl-CoA reductase/sulfur reductase-like enzyme